MAQIIKLKRSSTANKVPTTGNLVAGELAINTNDGRVFFERDDISIQHILTTDSETTGSIKLTGAVTASFFTGDGSAITSLDFDNISNLPSGLTSATTGILSSSAQLEGDIFVDSNFVDSTTIDFTVTEGASVTAIVINNSIDENKLKTSVAGTGLSGGNGSALSVNYGTSAGTAVQGNTSLTIQGTANEVDVSDGSITLGSGGTTTIGLPSTLVLGTVSGSVFSGSFVGDGAGLTGLATTLDIGIDHSGATSAGSIDLKTETLTFYGGEGLDISYNDSTNVVSMSAELASTSNLGVASFNSTNFSVSSGNVTSQNFTITAGNGLVDGGSLTLGGSTTLNVGAGTGVTVNANDIAIGQDVATTANVTFADISATGNVTISGDLTVLGDATEIQVSELRIEDKLITVASGSAGSAEADGGGIEIDGAGVSMTWNHATQRFDFDAAVSSSVGFYGDGSNLINVTAADVEYANVLNKPTLLSASVQVDHDATTNYVADEHIAHSSITLTAGDGLTGGGTIADNRTFTVGAGTGITVNTNDVALDTSNTRNVDHASITLTAGDGLTGGGTIADSRTFTVGAGNGITVNADDVAIDTASATFVSGSWSTLKAGTGISVNTSTGVISTDNIPNASLQNSSVNYGGVALSLGGSDTTPAFNLSDATAYPGDSSLTTLGTVTVGSVTAILPTGTVSGSGQVLLTGLADYDANDHIDHTAVSISAGDGLSGGGTIAATRTLTLDTGSTHFSEGVLAISDAAGSISSSIQIDHDGTANYVANEHIDHSTVSISPGFGMLGGGTIAATRTLTLDISSSHFETGVVNVIDTKGVVSSSAQINSNGIFDLTSDEVSQLANINSNTISNAQWGYLGNMNQSVATGENVVFADINATGNVVIDGDLSVLGNATEIQVAELRIEDKLITVASGSAGSAEADGAGLEIDGAGVSMTWNHATQRFDFNAAVSSSVGFYGDGSNLFNVTAASVAFNNITSRPSGLSSSTTGIVTSSAQVDHDATTNYVADEHVAHSSVEINSGLGLIGGGNITATRTLTLDTGSTHFADGTKTRLDAEGVFSSSAQVDIDGGTF